MVAEPSLVTALCLSATVLAGLVQDCQARSNGRAVRMGQTRENRGSDVRGARGICTRAVGTVQEQTCRAQSSSHFGSRASNPSAGQRVRTAKSCSAPLITIFF